MIKTCVVLNGEVINVGEWEDLDGTNPMPEGATVEEREFEYSEEYGWREVGWTPPLSDIDQLRLEQAKSSAELFEMMLMLTGGGS